MEIVNKGCLQLSWCVHKGVKDSRVKKSPRLGVGGGIKGTNISQFTGWPVE